MYIIFEGLMRNRKGNFMFISSNEKPSVESRRLKYSEFYRLRQVKFELTTLFVMNILPTLILLMGPS